MQAAAGVLAAHMDFRDNTVATLGSRCTAGLQDRAEDSKGRCLAGFSRARP